MGRAQGDGAVVEDGVLVRGDIGEESVYLQFTVRRVRAVSGRAGGEKAVGGRPEVGSSAGRSRSGAGGGILELLEGHRLETNAPRIWLRCLADHAA